MADNPRRIFTPGEAAGPTFGGSGVSQATLKARAEALKERPQANAPKVAAPKGENVAKQYPWMASIRMNHGVALNSYTKFMRANGEPGFYNGQHRRIYIDEIRIFLAPNTTDPKNGTFDMELARHVAVKLTKQNTRYVDRFIPTWNINTERNRINQWFKFNGIFRLPTQYYLQHGSVMTMRARRDPSVYAPTHWSFGLHGKDPINGYPYSLLKNIDMPTAPTDPTPIQQLIVFDENRDVPLKDCNIDVLAFNAFPASYAINFAAPPPSLCYPYSGVANTSFQFIPPEGPQWHHAEDWFPLQSLLWQPGLYVLWPTTHYYYQTNHVIHRPVVPYTLEEREEFTVEIQTIDAMTYNPGTGALTTVPIYCTMFGRQEALP